MTLRQPEPLSRPVRHPALYPPQSWSRFHESLLQHCDASTSAAFKVTSWEPENPTLFCDRRYQYTPLSAVKELKLVLPSTEVERANAISASLSLHALDLVPNSTYDPWHESSIDEVVGSEYGTSEHRDHPLDTSWAVETLVCTPNDAKDPGGADI